jgi:hypothetical protein
MSSSCRHTKSAKNFESAEVHPQAAPQERRLRLHKGRDVCPLAGKFQPTRHCSSSPQLNSHRRSGARAGHDCSFTALCEKLTNRPAHTHAHPHAQTRSRQTLILKHPHTVHVRPGTSNEATARMAEAPWFGSCAP